MSRQFDKFMVQVDIGTNRKLRRLPVAQRWAFVAGVLALAAQSPLRGALLIHDGEAATAQDVALEATVSLRDARAAMAALRRMGMLEQDSDGVEWVHDWDKLNPDPKPSDSPEASRERKRKQREKSRGHAHVTRDIGVTSRESHTPEVEVEEEEPPLSPPQAGGASHTEDLDEARKRLRPVAPNPPHGGRDRDKERFREDFAVWAAEHFPDGHVGSLIALVGQMRQRAVEPTPDAVREYVDHTPRWRAAIGEEGVA